VRRILILIAAIAVICAGALPPARTHAAEAETASGGPTPPPKEKCNLAKSKWQRHECEDYNDAAPGDEYFGRMKLSYLGIDNTFKDMSIEAGEFSTNPSIIAKLTFASEALARWASKYPHDPELGRSYYLGVLVYRKIYTPAGQQMAWQYMQYLIHHDAHDYFGKTIAAAIKDGFTEHWYADAQPCTAPGDDPPSPTPGPTKPGQPAVELIAPPCIATPAPAEPEVTATPSPSPRGRHAAPAPSPSPSPAATGSAAPVDGPNPQPPS